MPFGLRIPFSLPAQRAITDLDSAFERESGDLRFQLTFDSPYYFLTLDPFDTETVAKRFLENVRRGFAWALIETGIPADVVSYIDTARPVEGTSPTEFVGSGNAPCVFPTEGRTKFATALPVTALHSFPATRFFDAFRDGTFSQPVELETLDGRVSIALDLYRAHYSEASQTAQFLTMTMALECLAEELPKHPLARQLLDKWKTDIEQERVNCSDAEEQFALECLLNEIVRRKEVSKRRRIRTTVRELLRDNDEAAAAVGAYDARSTLVHEGHLPVDALSTAFQDAKRVVRKLLAKKLGMPLPDCK